MEADEQIRRIRNGDGKAFEEMFLKYYSRLCSFAVKIVKSPDLAKDCVQEVFLKIWRNREEWEINYSLAVYLYQAVRNQALNKAEKRKINRSYTQKYYQEELQKGSEEKRLLSEQDQLVKAIWEIAEGMPERRRTVFELNRKHSLSYKEIAGVMNIARKTVENHMGRALQDIRDQLKHKKF